MPRPLSGDTATARRSQVVMESGASTSRVACPPSSVRASSQIHVSGKNCRTRWTSARSPLELVLDPAAPAVVEVAAAAVVMGPAASIGGPACSAIPSNHICGCSISLPCGTFLLESTMRPASLKVSSAPGIISGPPIHSASCSSAWGCMYRASSSANTCSRFSRFSARMNTERSTATRPTLARPSVCTLTCTLSPGRASSLLNDAVTVCGYSPFTSNGMASAATSLFCNIW